MRKVLTLLAIIFALHTTAQRGIATSESGAKTTLDASAVVDAEATTKGMLIPRIVLSATNVAAPVVTPANSLLIYNTATSGTGSTAVSPGYYYWDTPSTQWIRLMAKSDSLLPMDSAEWIDGSRVGLAAGNIYARKSLLNGDTIVIKNSGFPSGSLGIGVPNPTASLHVKGLSLFNSDGGPVLRTRSSDGIKGMEVSNGSTYMDFIGNANRWFINRNVPTTLEMNYGGGSVIIGASNGVGGGAKLTVNGSTTDATADALLIRDSNIVSPRKLFNIRNDGFVGVGRYTPQAKFHVMNDADASYDSAFVVTNRGFVGIGTINPSGKFQVATNSSDSAFFVGNNNRVGINTINPLTNFHLRGNSIFQGFNMKIGDDATVQGAEFQVNNGTLEFRHLFGTYQINRFANTNMIFNAGGGSLLIGSISLNPARLSVVGTTANASAYAFMALDSNYNGSGKLFQVRNDGNVGVGKYAPQARFHVTIDQDGIFDSAVVVTSTSRMGIGTLTPSERLDVIGNIRASGNFISGATTLTVPDYVFEKYYTGESKLKADYTFKTLAEIEAFTKLNGHLPGIASAKEIKEQGSYNLTQSTLNNLEKIEELYLHIIEVNKQKELLETTVEKQQTQLEEQGAKIEQLQKQMEQLVQKK